jgi:hypothetical protein
MKIILSNFFKKSLLLNKKKYINIFFERKYNKNSKIIKKNISIKNFIKYKKLHFYKSFIKKEYKKKNNYSHRKIKNKISKKIYFNNRILEYISISRKNKKYKKNKNIIMNKNINVNVKFCVFLGREKNIKILHYYLEEALKNNIINEYHMFDFSRNNDDHLFINNEFNRLKLIYYNKIYLHNYDDNEITLKKPRVKTDWNPFYKTISKWSDNDVVIKCDDDILFIDINSLKNAINDRIQDKISFLIHSNCINNGVCAYYQKDLFPKLKNELSKYPTGGIMGILFEKPELAYVLHNQFSSDLLMNMNNLNKYLLDDIYITTRISINFILINGSDLKYLENVGIHDEYEVSSLIPEKLLRPNKIKGDLITSHLSYTFQDKILLNRHELLVNYQKIAEKYIVFNKDILRKKVDTIIPKVHLKNEVFKIKNCFNQNHYYIKCIDNNNINKYLYIDYEEDQLKLSDQKRTIFEINEKSKNIIEIKLGIYFITFYSTIGKFRNETIYSKYFRDEKEKELIKEYSNESNSFYLKFAKYNNYLSIKNNDYISISPKPEFKWIFEKIEYKDKEFIYLKRELKNNKFYYTNIEYGDIYTNYYLGWGIDGLLF